MECVEYLDEYEDVVKSISICEEPGEFLTNADYMEFIEELEDPKDLIDTSVSNKSLLSNDDSKMSTDHSYGRSDSKKRKSVRFSLDVIEKDEQLKDELNYKTKDPIEYYYSTMENKNKDRIEKTDGTYFNINKPKKFDWIVNTKKPVHSSDRKQCEYYDMKRKNIKSSHDYNYSLMKKMRNKQKSDDYYRKGMERQLTRDEIFMRRIKSKDIDHTKKRGLSFHDIKAMNNRSKTGYSEKVNDNYYTQLDESKRTDIPIRRDANFSHKIRTHTNVTNSYSSDVTETKRFEMPIRRDANYPQKSDTCTDANVYSEKFKKERPTGASSSYFDDVSVKRDGSYSDQMKAKNGDHFLTKSGYSNATETKKIELPIRRDSSFRNFKTIERIKKSYSSETKRFQLPIRRHSISRDSSMEGNTIKMKGQEQRGSGNNHYKSVTVNKELQFPSKHRSVADKRTWIQDDLYIDKIKSKSREKINHDFYSDEIFKESENDTMSGNTSDLKAESKDYSISLEEAVKKNQRLLKLNETIDHVISGAILNNRDRSDDNITDRRNPQTEEKKIQEKSIIKNEYYTENIHKTLGKRPSSRVGNYCDVSNLEYESIKKRDNVGNFGVKYSKTTSREEGNISLIKNKTQHKLENDTFENNEFQQKDIYFNSTRFKISKNLFKRKEKLIQKKIEIKQLRVLLSRSEVSRYLKERAKAKQNKTFKNVTPSVGKQGKNCQFRTLYTTGKGKESDIKNELNDSSIIHQSSKKNSNHKNDYKFGKDQIIDLDKHTPEHVSFNKPTVQETAKYIKPKEKFEKIWKSNKIGARGIHNTEHKSNTEKSVGKTFKENVIIGSGTLQICPKKPEVPDNSALNSIIDSPTDAEVFFSEIGLKPRRDENEIYYLEVNEEDTDIEEVLPLEENRSSFRKIYEKDIAALSRKVPTTTPKSVNVKQKMPAHINVTSDNTVTLNTIRMQGKRKDVSDTPIVIPDKIVYKTLPNHLLVETKLLTASEFAKIQIGASNLIQKAAVTTPEKPKITPKVKKMTIELLMKKCNELIEQKVARDVQTKLQEISEGFSWDSKNADEKKSEEIKKKLKDIDCDIDTAMKVYQLLTNLLSDDSHSNVPELHNIVEQNAINADSLIVPDSVNMQQSLQPGNNPKLLTKPRFASTPLRTVPRIVKLDKQKIAELQKQNQSLSKEIVSEFHNYSSSRHQQLPCQPSNFVVNPMSQILVPQTPVLRNIDRTLGHTDPIIEMTAIEIKSEDENENELDGDANINSELSNITTTTNPVIQKHNVRSTNVIANQVKVNGRIIINTTDPEDLLVPARIKLIPESKMKNFASSTSTVIKVSSNGNNKSKTQVVRPLIKPIPESSNKEIEKRLLEAPPHKGRQRGKSGSNNVRNLKTIADKNTLNKANSRIEQQNQTQRKVNETQIPKSGNAKESTSDVEIIEPPDSPYTEDYSLDTGYEFKCQKCSMVQPSRSLIREHIEKVHTNPSQLCSVCGVVLRSVESMQKHFAEKHDIK